MRPPSSSASEARLAPLDKPRDGGQPERKGAGNSTHTPSCSRGEASITVQRRWGEEPPQRMTSPPAKRKKVTKMQVSRGAIIRSESSEALTDISQLENSNFRHYSLNFGASWLLNVYLCSARARSPRDNRIAARRRSAPVWVY